MQSRMEEKQFSPLVRGKVYVLSFIKPMKRFERNGDCSQNQIKVTQEIIIINQYAFGLLSSHVDIYCLCNQTLGGVITLPLKRCHAASLHIRKSQKKTHKDNVKMNYIHTYIHMYKLHISFLNLHIMFNLQTTISLLNIVLKHLFQIQQSYRAP